MKDWKKDPNSYYNQPDIRYLPPFIASVCFSVGLAVFFDRVFDAGRVGLVIGLAVCAPILAFLVWRGDKKKKDIQNEKRGPLQ